MKMVEFTRDMLPQRAGETRVVPDAVAEKLIAAGDAKPRDSVFDKAESRLRPLPEYGSDSAQPRRVKNSPAKPSIGKSYKTRKRG